MIALAKLIAWWVALGSGTSGGTLAPILLISAAFGSVVGAGLNEILPGSDVALGAFAVVAMAATFGACTRATFTSIVFVFELTRDYDVILPLMLATVIADLVYSAFNDESIMTEKLRRRGLNIGRHYGVDPFTTATVGQIMTVDVQTMPVSATAGDARAHASTDVVTVRPDGGANEVLHVMLDESVEHVPVLDGETFVGICTRTDLLKVRRVQRELERKQRGSTTITRGALGRIRRARPGFGGDDSR